MNGRLSAAPATDVGSAAPGPVMSRAAGRLELGPAARLTTAKARETAQKGFNAADIHDAAQLYVTRRLGGEPIKYLLLIDLK
jgi:hypothetical protein